MSGDVVRLARFLAVGVVNTAVGYAIYAVLVMAGLHPQPALAVAFVLGVMWNYLTHARIVFGSGGVRRMPYYFAVYAGLYLFNSWALARLLKAAVSPLVAQAGLSVVMAGLSFFLISLALTGRVPFLSRGGD